MAVTQQSILKERRPILLVVRDAEDGTWQFLDGREFRMETAMLVALRTILAHDATVRSLADLPPGWQAQRARPEAPWIREKSVE